MRPLLNARAAQEYLNVTFPAAQKALNALVEAEILAEITGGRRNRVYAAKEILEVLEEDIIAPRAKDNEDKKRAR
jgi:hypothetical protein